MLSVVKKFGIFPVRSRGSMRFLYRALHWLQIGCQNPGKLTVGAYPSVSFCAQDTLFSKLQRLCSWLLCQEVLTVENELSAVQGC